MERRLRARRDVKGRKLRKVERIYRWWREREAVAGYGREARKEDKWREKGRWNGS